MDLSLVKNTDGGKWHRAWATKPDGTSASVKIFVPHDLDHFVIEASLGIAHGFWGLFASGGWRRQSQLSTARDPRRAAAGQLEVDDPVMREHGGDANVAETVVNAIGNMFGDGSNTIEAVIDRLRQYEDPRVDAIAEQLNDTRLSAIYDERARLLSDWQALEPGGVLRLTWPLSN